MDRGCICVFTGLIETVGIIVNISRQDEIVRLEIDAPAIAGELRLGDSVDVSGACLTVVKKDEVRFSVEMMQETVSVTKFRNLKVGSRVNLERALRAGSRLDGHYVAGHVDGIAEVSEIENYGNTRKYFFSADKSLTGVMITKGSVAIDGVSLTLINVTDTGLSVGIIPSTLSDTTISELKKGDLVNIETDMLGKYIAKLLSSAIAGAGTDGGVKSPLSWDKLAQYGWI